MIKKSTIFNKLNMSVGVALTFFFAAQSNASDGTLVDVCLTGADIAAYSETTFPTLQPTLSGSSLVFEAGVSYSTLVDIPLTAPGDIAPGSPIVISIAVSQTRLTADNDLLVVISDGGAGYGGAAQDNLEGVLIAYQVNQTGNSYSWNQESFIGTDAVAPAIGDAQEFSLTLTLNAGYTTVSGQWNAVDSAQNLGGVLDVANGLSLQFLAEDGGEEYQINAVCVSIFNPNDADTDGDGVPNVEDECPNSDTSDTVIIGGCDSGVANLVLPSGCTVADLVAQAADGARNHGQFVSSVASLTNALKKAGLISGKDKGRIQSCAAKSNRR